MIATPVRERRAQVARAAHRVGLEEVVRAHAHAHEAAEERSSVAASSLTPRRSTVWFITGKPASARRSARGRATRA